MKVIPARRMDEDVIATTRNVYRTGRDTVIKVAQKPRFKSVNEREYEHWQEYKDSTVFAPIVDHTPDFSKIEMVECRRLMRGRRNRLRRNRTIVKDLSKCGT